MTSPLRLSRQCRLSIASPVNMDFDPRTVEFFLQPGEYFVGRAGHRVRTLLGSCVSITLWHPIHKIGAMSHFLLSSRGSFPAQELDARYGDEAMRMMMQDLRNLGVKPHQCQAKLFGGGNMFPGQASEFGINIGRKNGEAAKAILRSHDIDLVSESLFGTGHRQIVFDIASGDVWMRQVAPAAPSTLALKRIA